MGDSIATNLFMLGYAWQKGLMPLSLEALMRAIELNGVAVESKQAHLRLGPPRRARSRRRGRPPQAGACASRSRSRVRSTRSSPSAVELLTAYQDAAYAERYRALVDKVARGREATRRRAARGLAEAVAKSLYKLMAYKDEYEVARLYSDGEFQKKLRAAVRGRLQAHLPPRAAAVRRARSGDRRAQEERVRPAG